MNISENWYLFPTLLSIMRVNWEPRNPHDTILGWYLNGFTSHYLRDVFLSDCYLPKIIVELAWTGIIAAWLTFGHGHCIRYCSRYWKVPSLSRSIRVFDLCLDKYLDLVIHISVCRWIQLYVLYDHQMLILDEKKVQDHSS